MDGSGETFTNDTWGCFADGMENHHHLIPAVVEVLRVSCKEVTSLKRVLVVLRYCNKECSLPNALKRFAVDNNKRCHEYSSR